MNIKELIKEAHENAVERGFYDCPECGGDQTTGGCTEDGDCFSCDKYADNCLLTICQNCNGTGINPNKNIGELLMLIVSELGEALEAHRCRRFALKDETTHFVTMFTLDNVEKDYIWISEFESHIKDTFEDEIADVFIRLFDFMGYLEIPLNKDFYKCGYGSNPIDRIKENIGDELMIWISEIVQLNASHKEYEDQKESCTANFGYLIKRIEIACQKWNIHIEKHIKAKMAYNRTREHKHGKQY